MKGVKPPNRSRHNEVEIISKYSDFKNRNRNFSKLQFNSFFSFSYLRNENDFQISNEGFVWRMPLSANNIDDMQYNKRRGIDVENVEMHSQCYHLGVER